MQIESGELWVVVSSDDGCSSPPCVYTVRAEAEANAVLQQEQYQKLVSRWTAPSPRVTTSVMSLRDAIVAAYERGRQYGRDESNQW